MSATSLPDWFTTPLGRYVQAREQAWLDATVPDIFGFHGVQLGLVGIDFLRESRTTHRFAVSEAACDGAALVAQFHELPFDAQSIDLCLLPHVLEFAANPHEVLREVDRVMRPEGRVVILSFNPWSLFGVRKLWSDDGAPWNGNFVSLVRMRDWLQLLGFEPADGRLACYIPPVQSTLWQSRWRFMEGIGDRWWGVTGGVYMIQAIKRVQGMRLIAPAWSQPLSRDRKFAAAANRVAGRTAGPVSPLLRVVK